MTTRDNSISAWQTGILMFILMLANKVSLLPSLLYKDAKIEAIIVPIILSVFELILVGVFLLIKSKYKDESFSQILTHYCGKVVTKIVYVIFMIFFLSKTVLLYNVTYMFFNSVIYKQSDNILFLFCFLPVIVHLACCGIRAMGRTLQLYFPVIVVLMLFCIIVGIFGINSKTLLFQSSALTVFKTTFKHISAFGDSLILFVLMDKIQIKKKQWKVVSLLTGLGLLFVNAVNIVFLLSYTYTSFMHPYALFELMNYVKEYGGMGRIDILSMVNIVLLTYFQLAIYLKGFMVSFHEVFKLDKIYSVVTYILLFLLLIMFVVMNLDYAVYFGQTILPYLSIFSFIIIPLLSLVFICLKKRGKP